MYINENDMKNICKTDSIDWERFRDRTILISGATGLIGTTISNALVFANRERRLGLRIIGVVRNEERARERLDSEVQIHAAPLDEKLVINGSVDFIIHAASPTSSSFFVNQPVETIKIAVSSTINLLELAREKKVEGFVYLSSMEVYGHPEKGHDVKESEVAGFDPTVVRNCYPQSKLICEMLCKAYQNEYDVPTKIVRLTQTFGPGVEYDDSRVFAEFMRCAIEKKDIVLHTSGRTERCYLYTAEAVTAILTVLTRGRTGEAYTAANRDTYCSILDMANMVASEAAHGEIEVLTEIDEIERGYASVLYMKLDTSKIEKLGWKASVGLPDMYMNMIG